MKRTHTIAPFGFGPKAASIHGERFFCVGVARMEKNGDVSYLCIDYSAEDERYRRQPPATWVRVKTRFIHESASVREDSGEDVGSTPAVLRGEGAPGPGS